MDWTKVKPGSMPDDGQEVIVTVLDDDGERFVEYRAMYDYTVKKWFYFDICSRKYEEFSKHHTVAHWTEQVKPAEDKEDL